MRRILLTSAAAFQLTNAAPTDWNGVWTEPMYGGDVNVCVSVVDGVSYATAQLSTIGYMKGTIDASDVWTGNYYIMGQAVTKGTFSLTSANIADAAATYAAVWTQAPGYNIGTSGTRKSSVTPADKDCFKTTDGALLSGAKMFDWNGSKYLLIFTESTSDFR
jgi:hypothetical protein